MSLVPVKIFKAGEYSRGGKTESYPVSMLDEVVETFDLSRHRPPLIFSHHTPAGVPDRELADDPFTFGVPEKVERRGEELFAHFDSNKLKPRFKEWVKTGNVSGKSPGFYPPDHPDNPVPGKWALREISVLGTKAPVNPNLPGLQTEFNFADTVIEFAIPADPADFFPAEAGVALLPKPIHPREAKMTGEIQGIAQGQITKELAAFPEFAKLARAHMEATGKTIDELSSAVGMPVAELQSRLSGTIEFARSEAASVTQALLHKPQPSAREIELEKQLAEFAAERQESRKRELSEFAKGLASKEKGILLPGEVDGQIAVLEALQAAPNTVEFAGEGKISALEAHKKFLSGLKPRIDYSESEAGKNDEPEEFAEFAKGGNTKDFDDAKLWAKAKAYQQQNKCDYLTALSAVGGN